LLSAREKGHDPNQGRDGTVRDLVVAGGVLFTFLVYLLLERLGTARARAAVPIRVAVTGTRGKSSVVRLIAAGLRADGRKVVAKTTGSQAVFIDQCGEEIPLRRLGQPRILEQCKVLRRAAKAGAEVLVVEVMSIRPENYAAELGGILAPSLLVVTNVRLDHVSDIGASVDEAGRTFAHGVPRSARVFVLSEAVPATLLESLAHQGALVQDCSTIDTGEALSALPYLEWQGNLQLALAVCEALGVNGDVALAGMEGVRSDFGALRAWRIEAGRPPRRWVAVNAFAANEPESTLAALERARETFALGEARLVGLLNLRSDRADRTEQWCRELAKVAPVFDQLFVTGGGAAAALRRLRKTYGAPVFGLRARRPERIMEEIAAAKSEGGALFGFGNIAGTGDDLVRHWERAGELL
jgi:poly-gamma-glutamate synthase PgsB/CapB